MYKAIDPKPKITEEKIIEKLKEEIELTARQIAEKELFDEYDEANYDEVIDIG